MISQRTANLVFAAALMSAALAAGWMALGFETPPLGDATLPTEFFPLVLVGFIALCTAVYAWEYLSRGESGGDGGERLYGNAAQARRGLTTMAAAVLAGVLWDLFGFAPAALFATLAVTFAMGTRDWRHYLVVIACAASIYAAFVLGLGTQFR